MTKASVVNVKDVNIVLFWRYGLAVSRSIASYVMQDVRQRRYEVTQANLVDPAKAFVTRTVLEQRPLLQERQYFEGATRRKSFSVSCARPGCNFQVWLDSEDPSRVPDQACRLDPWSMIFSYDYTVATVAERSLKWTCDDSLFGADQERHPFIPCKPFNDGAFVALEKEGICCLNIVPSIEPLFVFYDTPNKRYGIVTRTFNFALGSLAPVQFSEDDIQLIEWFSDVDRLRAAIYWLPLRRIMQRLDLAYPEHLHAWFEDSLG